MPSAPNIPGSDNPVFKYVIPGTTQTYDAFAKGDYGPSIDSIPLIGDAKKSWFDDPANEQKAAFDQAMQLNNSGTSSQMNFLANQQKQAAGYYKPLQNMFAASYGTQGMQAPQAPTAAGKPLANMYGGG